MRNSAVLPPTEPQLDVISRWIHWEMPISEAREAVDWLRDNSTRKEVSAEVSRLHDLYHKRNMSRETIFSSKIWEGFHEQD